MISVGARGTASALDEPRLDSGVLQHALDHLAEAAGFCSEKLPVSLHAIAAADDAVRQVLGGRSDHGDRRAQLVRDAGDELHLLRASRCARREVAASSAMLTRQEQKHAEADRQVLAARTRDRRLERSALMLDEQTPTPEIVNRSFARPIGERVAAESSAFIAARGTVAHRWARRASRRKTPGCRFRTAMPMRRRGPGRPVRLDPSDTERCSNHQSRDRDAIDVAFQCVKCRDASSGSICSRICGMFSSMIVKPNMGVTV